MNAFVNETIDKATFIFNNLHFIRVEWFYAFVPLILFLFFAYNQTSTSRNWHGVIDKQLLPFVLNTSNNKRRRYPLLLVFIAASLCITALAGPVYKQLPQPVYREQSSLVVLLDLSQSMNASDVKPSRLARAKLELLDILKTRKTGQTAFIVYAADAFVVTPLTDDNATIANLIPSLETSMMPAQGSNLSSALAKAYSLFTQSGIINGNILVITDGIHQRDEAAIEKVASQGHRLSIFGIGTNEGSPIPLSDGGFLQDKNGAIVIPKLQPAELQKFALKGGGLYTSVRADDSDVIKLTRLFQSSEVTQQTDNEGVNADVWQEEGFWLLLPLLFFAALWARKGWLAIALIFILPLPQPAHAEPAFIDTGHLWSTPDQKAMKAFESGDNASAAQDFTQPEWKASAYYRDGNYEAAAKVLEEIDNSDGYYNRANALAKLGNYEEAIKAYDKAIELDPSNNDAKYNRDQVKKAIEEQASEDNKSDQDKSDQNKSDQDQEKQDESEQDKSEQQNDQQSDQSQDSQQKDSKEQQSDEQKSDPSSEQSSEQNQQDSKNEHQEKSKEQQENTDTANEDKDLKKAEEEQLKQRDAEQEKQQQQAEKQQYEQDQKETKDGKEDESDSVENKEGDEKPKEIEINPVEASITEKEKATEQWLKRIPDDPGGLLKRKFLYQYNQAPNQHDDNEPW